MTSSLSSYVRVDADSSGCSPRDSHHERRDFGADPGQLL